MDLNEYAKQAALGIADQFNNLKGQVGFGLRHAAGQVGEDLTKGAAIANHPYNAWIGMNPVGRIGMEGLGLLAGVLRATGGSREALNPFLMQAWKRGEELSKIQEAVRTSPQTFGFETPGAWRKSLHDQDKFSMWMYENTAQKLASNEMREQNILERNLPPTDQEIMMLEARKQFPPGESDASYALGLDRLSMARKRAKEQ